MDLHAPTVAGYTACVKCGTFVLNEIAFKTRGHCAECFRVNIHEILDAAVVVTDGRERVVLRTVSHKHSPGDRAQRKRAKKRARATAKEQEHRRLVHAAHHAADRRLRALFAELWEVLLADERAARGLNAWTIERALTPGEASADLAFLAQLRRLAGVDEVAS